MQRSLLRRPSNETRHRSLPRLLRLFFDMEAFDEGDLKHPLCLDCAEEAKAFTHDHVGSSASMPDAAWRRSDHTSREFARFRSRRGGTREMRSCWPGTITGPT